MISRDPECECEISAEMIWAGPAIQLCHHSTVAEAEKVQEKLMDLMTNFSQNIDANSMFDKTIIQLATEYREQAAGRLKQNAERGRTPHHQHQLHAQPQPGRPDDRLHHDNCQKPREDTTGRGIQPINPGSPEQFRTPTHRGLAN